MGELGGQRRWLDGLGWVALYALVWALFTEGAGWIGNFRAYEYYSWVGA